MKPMRVGPAVLLWAAFCQPLPGGAEEAKDVGVLAAVNRDMTGARPSEAARDVFIKDRLVSSERIETTADGGGQILFLDQTSLTVSPQASLVLDKYVFDPDKRTGEIGVSLARGALRLVGGKITKSAAATIRTPSATIGIRGGIGHTMVEEDGSTIHFHLAGISSTIVTATGTLTITREGGYARIGPDGTITYLGVATPDVLAAAMGRGAGRGDGGVVSGIAGAGGVARIAGGRIGEVAVMVSSAPGAPAERPISTIGQREMNADDETPELTFDSLRAEFALAGLASGDIAAVDPVDPVPPVDPVAPNPTPTFDGVFFSGTYSVATTGQSGSPAGGTYPFSMAYSVSEGFGNAVLGLPAVEVFVPSQPDPNGQPFISEVIYVVGQDLALVPAPGFETGLGGNPAGTSFTINPNGPSVGGDVRIDYANSSVLQEILTAEGTVVNVGGIVMNGPDFVQGLADLKQSLGIN